MDSSESLPVDAMELGRTTLRHALGYHTDGEGHSVAIGCAFHVTNTRTRRLLGRWRRYRRGVVLDEVVALPFGEGLQLRRLRRLRSYEVALP